MLKDTVFNGNLRLTANLFRDLDKLGDILKQMEASTGAYIIPGQPVIMRLDGKNFSSFTRGLKRPFDARLSLCMALTAKYIAKMFGASLAYTQSDEITLVIPNPVRILTGTDTVSGIPFSGRVQKLVSIAAAKASVYFNMRLQAYLPEKLNNFEQDNEDGPCLDCRVFSVPDMTWAMLAFYWRQADCFKNAVTMAARSMFSDKQILNKCSKDKIQMMFEKGVVFSNYPGFFRQGTTFLLKKEVKMLDEQTLAKIPVDKRPTEPVLRSVYNEVYVENLARYIDPLSEESVLLGSFNRLLSELFDTSLQLKDCTLLGLTDNSKSEVVSKIKAMLVTQ